MMLKKLVLCFCVMGVLALCFTGCGGSNPFACFQVEGNGDSIHVNEPVVINGYCSSQASQYNWQINDDSVYFTPRITLHFATPGEHTIYLLVTNGRKSSGTSEKIRVYP
ncbi:MAG TPA: PKD domain-containing protein [Chitinophagales bacterium]|nr:PKD domain-containing protein [Chitinophagales bacterium]